MPSSIPSAPLDDHPAPPELWHSLSEGVRALFECQQLLLARPFLKRAPQGDGHPVMTLPGFGGADGCMAPLRSWITRWGYDARPWELGRNFPKYKMSSLDEAMLFREKMVARAARQLEKIYLETGQKVSLVGWSLGGIYAHELGQLHPEWVRRVITLGTPHGDPRGTAAWDIMRRAYNSNVPEEVQDISGWLVANAGEQKVPMTVIFSPTDGIVSQEVAMIGHPSVRHLAVNSSHLGFAINPKVYWLLAKELARTV